MCFLCIFPEVIMFLIFNLDWNLKDFPQTPCGDYQRLIITSLINVERHKNRWKCEMLHWLTALRGGSVCDSRDGAAPGGHRRALLSPGPRGRLTPIQKEARPFQAPRSPFFELLMFFVGRTCTIFYNWESTTSQARETRSPLQTSSLPSWSSLTSMEMQTNKMEKIYSEWGAGEPVVETPDGAWTQALGLQTRCFLWDKCPSSPQIPAPTSVLQDSARALLSMAAVGGTSSCTLRTSPPFIFSRASASRFAAKNRVFLFYDP